MQALWLMPHDDSKHQRTFYLGVWAPPPRLTAPLGLAGRGFFRQWYCFDIRSANRSAALIVKVRGAKAGAVRLYDSQGPTSRIHSWNGAACRS